MVKGFGLLCIAWALMAATPPPKADVGPVIDMHIHAYGGNGEGPPSYVCAPFPAWRALDPGNGGDGLSAYLRDMFGNPTCPSRVFSVKDDDELRVKTIAALRRNDVYAVAGGSPKFVDRWLEDEPIRLIPAIGAGSPGDLPSVDELRRRYAAGQLKVISELSFQYQGIAPDDPRMEPYWSLAEELDIPVGIHMGPGAPGTTYFATPAYRAVLTDPLLLEPILVRHPKLRVFVIHAGYPMKERMMALMAAHPQVYAEFGFLTVGYRDSDVWPYINAFVDAGFEDRILYGTDQMVWPDLVDVSINRVRRTAALSQAVKRKFLYTNAARFLRINPAADMKRR